MKKVLGGFILVAIVAAIGLAAGYWHFSDLMPQRGQPAERAGAGEVPAALESVATLEIEEPGSGARPVASPSATAHPQSTADGSDEGPKVELLRVEPDGSAIIAGRAEPTSEIVVRSGGAIVARDRAGASGDFAVTLDQPLAVGDHELSVESTGPDGSRLASDDVAIVSVPPRGREQELLVTLGAPNAPTQLLAVPSATLPDGQPSQAPETASASVPQDATTTALDAPDVVPASAPAPVGPSELSVAAVEIEGDTLYVAGTARPGSRVRIYLDDAFIAAAEGRDAGQFIAESSTSVPVGPHVVRVDQISPDGSVAARVAVPFDRPEGTSMAALAPRLGQGSPVPAAIDVDQGEAPARSANAVAPADPSGAVAELRGSLPADASERQPMAGAQTQAALEPVDGRVIIRRGDTLWRISRETYGLGSRYTVIYLANGDQIRDPDHIYPGQIFRLPEDEAQQTVIR